MQLAKISSVYWILCYNFLHIVFGSEDHGILHACNQNKFPMIHQWWSQTDRKSALERIKGTVQTAPYSACVPANCNFSFALPLL